MLKRKSKKPKDPQSRMNKKKITPGCIIIKMLKIRNWKKSEKQQEGGWAEDMLHTWEQKKVL